MCDLDGNGCDGKICKSYGTECENVKNYNYFKCIKKIGPTIFFDKFIKETIQIRKVFLKNYEYDIRKRIDQIAMQLHSNLNWRSIDSVLKK